MEATTTSTRTSHERDDKSMGADVTMIPLVDMMNDDCLHAMDNLIDISLASLPITCDDFAVDMLCPKCLQCSPIVASKMLNNSSFKCLVCNNVAMLSNEIAPIAFSNFRYFRVPMLRIFHPSLCMLPIHIFHTSHLLLVRLVMCK